MTCRAYIKYYRAATEIHCNYISPSTIIMFSQSWNCHLWSGAPMSHLSFLDRVQLRMKKLVGSALYSTLQPLSQCRYVASLLSLFYSIGTTSASVSIASTHRCFQHLLLPAPLVELTLCTLSVSKFLLAGLFPGHLDFLFAWQINGRVFQPTAFQIGMTCQRSSAV